MKQLRFPALLLCLCLLLCACGSQPAETQPADTLPAQTEPAPEAPADALSRLRADMLPPVMAVADFGFPDLGEIYGEMDYLKDKYPAWLEENDFVRDLPQSRIIRTCGLQEDAQLLCIVPGDPDASVLVEVSYAIDQPPYVRSSVAYQSDTGEPFLLLADIAGDVTVLVTVTDSTGRGVSWQPYWGNYEPIPEDAFGGALVMDITPQAELTAYDLYGDMGWYAPERQELQDRSWKSDFGYALDLAYAPGQYYDGTATLYDVDGADNYTVTYSGSWAYLNGCLELTLTHVQDNSKTVSGAFPVLADPMAPGCVALFASAEGTGLPGFLPGSAHDELFAVSGDALSPYDYALSQGWYQPEAYELLDSFWLSQSGYALELTEDGVPGDGAGWAAIYDVGSYGEYTKSYSGSWRWENGRLWLSLVPVGNGVLVDDSFPVLLFDGWLWIGRSDTGEGLPHFGADQLTDVLEAPMG